MADGETDLLPTELSASYYIQNSQMATWHNGKVYALGHSPSEPGKMYFRATSGIELAESEEPWTMPTDEEASAETMRLIEELPAASEIDDYFMHYVVAAKDSYDELSASARDLVPPEAVAKLDECYAVAAEIQSAIDSATATVRFAKDLCEKAGIAYDDNLTPAENIDAAQKAIQEKDAAEKRAIAQAMREAAGIAYDESKTPAENIDAANAAVRKAVADAGAAKGAQAKAQADLAAAKSSIAKNVKTVTVDVKTVTAAAIAAAIAKVGGDPKYVTTIVIGPKVKTIKASAFAKCKKVKTLQVQTKKLKKASVKKSLKGSKVKTIIVNVATAKAHDKLMKKYKKIFTKKNAGKKAKVK